MFWFLCISGERDLPGSLDSRENLLISLRIWRDRFPSQPWPLRITSGNRYVVIPLHISRETEISNCTLNAPRKRSDFFFVFLRIWGDRFPSQPRTVDKRTSYTEALATDPTRKTFWFLCMSGWQNLRFYAHDGTGRTWMPIQGIETTPTHSPRPPKNWWPNQQQCRRQHPSLPAGRRSGQPNA